MFIQYRSPFTNLYKRKIIFIRGERQGWDGKTERGRMESRKNKKASMFYKSITKAYTYTAKFGTDNTIICAFHITKMQNIKS